MEFTYAEMIFFNTLAKGPDPFRIVLPPTGEAEREAFIKNTVKSLQEKQVIGADGKLTDLGVIPIRAMELYKSAEEYLVINGLCFAWPGEKQFITAIPKEGGYDFCCIPPWQLMYHVVSSSPYLKTAGEDFEETGHLVQPVWLRSVHENREYAVIERYRNKEKVEQKAYYVQHGRGYLYDLLKEEQVQLSSRQMRICLLRDLHLFKHGRVVTG